MTGRREFPDRIKVLILKRAMDENGRVRCEGCGGALKAKAYEFDHRIAEALVIDKSNALTADDGQLLGPCCHRGEDGKTAKDVGVIAKAKRVEARFLGIRKRSTFPGGRSSPWKMKIGGRTERRT